LRSGSPEHRKEISVMVKPDSKDRRPAAQREMPGLAGPRRWAAAGQDRYQGSLAQSFVLELKTLDFAQQIILFGAGLLVSLLPFLILLSAFASARVDDDLALRLGLNQRASGIVSHLFTSSPAVLNVATVTSLIFVAAGTLAVASSLQQIYEKAFAQDPRGMRDWYRLPVWVFVLCAVVVFESLVGRPVRNASAGPVLAELVTFAVMTPFFWWTMHFLLSGRVSWRRLLLPAIATGAFFAGLGVFSKFYFSATIISDSRTYGTIGAVFGILTWLIAIGAVIILGAVVGVVWDRRSSRAETQ
jgi:membrane protein